jgi:hypothetical protein
MRSGPMAQRWAQTGLAPPASAWNGSPAIIVSPMRMASRSLTSMALTAARGPLPGALTLAEALAVARAIARLPDLMPAR